mmetsp:Transcript_14519/g.23645  ORF Transcript_14519/g.23645 Transcript_14519/m.23645 type:complete len:387 (+) Transcript_14519:729-1889(+)|eukprot:CAMPEP_0203753298 /NCGR_PEP_ID=MMETSP0098-20131031/7085_1 /ASSEMBLY_ACC=CAM_ASM_000208 /TAXON_ID=96639 /ORGANISM=" , Strain NY0313808BC1" /LENGTH=386 /DNA_ID=CAMNT_0050643829 /DNA_START=589 /DNA_END=1749 /DNA_ORIENTATION=+
MAESDGCALRIVIKIGTSSLIGEDHGITCLSLSQIAATVEVLSALRRAGHHVVLVSSGAVGAGCQKLGLHGRPKSVVARQALASIGQVHLMGKYDLLFSSLGQKCAQVLLTYENFVDRDQFLNAKNTFTELFNLGCVPIVNENDCVGIQELKADNDKLAGMVGNMIGADVVFLMTDVDGVYTANPFTDENATRIKFVDNISALKEKCSLGDGEDSNWGTGGMSAKINAAGLAASLGVRAVIMSAEDVTKIKTYVEQQVREKLEGIPCDFEFGTTFAHNSSPPIERKRWIRSLLRRGTIIVDDGASAAVSGYNTLFAAGCLRVEGNFDSFEAVSVVDKNGTEIACGLCNFSSDDLRKVLGMTSEETFNVMGTPGNVIERSNLDLTID